MPQHRYFERQIDSEIGAPAFSFFPSGQNQCSAVQISAIADKERMSVNDKPQDDFFRVQVGRLRGQDDQP
jgi:hypothetical protein